MVRTRKNAIAIGVMLGLIGGIAAGKAWADVDRHERIVVKPIHQQGAAVGFKLKMTLRPESYDTVRVGLGRMQADAAHKNHAEKDSALRLLASGEHEGYLRVRFPEITGLTKGQPHEVEWEVKYGEGNDLKPGEKVDVVSAWKGTNTMNYEGKPYTYWHVFGMHDGPVNQGDMSSVIDLPDK